ncbi:unnamed protein product, partial [Ectocarpus sp. 12 AP-2014]
MATGEAETRCSSPVAVSPSTPDGPSSSPALAGSKEPRSAASCGSASSAGLEGASSPTPASEGGFISASGAYPLSSNDDFAPPPAASATSSPLSIEIAIRAVSASRRMLSSSILAMSFITVLISTASSSSIG